MKYNILYNSFGKPSISPLVFFKLLIINYVFGINSMRKTLEEYEANIAIDNKIADYST